MRRWSSSAVRSALTFKCAADDHNHRARVYHYQGQLELADEELQKGLSLEPRHPLLRTSLGYQQMRQGNMLEAIKILEAVIRDDDSMRIALPTASHCYVQVERESVPRLSSTSCRSSAAARPIVKWPIVWRHISLLREMRAKRFIGCAGQFISATRTTLGSYRILAEQRSIAHTDFERILEDLKKSFRRNQKNWKRLLENVPNGEDS